jgi:hypothetical protein
MKVRIAIRTKDVERSIHESLYLVIFINLSAIEAAIICSAIEINRAMSRTIVIKI